MNPNERNTYIYKCVRAPDKHQELNALDIVRLPILSEISNYIVDIDTVEGFVGRIKPGAISGVTFQTQDDIKNGYTVVKTKKNEIIDNNNNFKNGTCLWQCYKCPNTDIPSEYFINNSKICPVKEMDVTDIQYDGWTNRPRGRLPGIRNMSWKFCCNLVDKKSQLLKDVKFFDKGFRSIINCLRDCSNYTDFVDESDLCYDIIIWIQCNCASLDNVEIISKTMPEIMYTNLVCYLRDFQNYVDFADVNDACSEILRRIQLKNI